MGALLLRAVLCVYTRVCVAGGVGSVYVCVVFVQGRAEALGMFLALSCVALPAVGEELEARAGVRGGGATGRGSVEGAREVFAFSEQLPEEVRQELGWATLALLRNTGAAGVLLGGGGRAWAARGAMPAALAGAEGTGAEEALRALAPAVAHAEAIARGSSSAGGVYLEDASAATRAGASDLVPEGAQSALLIPLPGGAGGVLLLLAQARRAFSPKDRAWAATLVEKLGGIVLRPS